MSCFRLSVSMCCIGLLIPLLAATAEEPQDSADRDYSDELPRIDPVSASETLSTFEIQPGYRIELVAAEPLVHDPVAMDFDEYGRLFVVEMRGYSEEFEAGISAVRMLVDEDNDGVFDKSSVYVDGLTWPVAVACWDGGIFVGEPPNITYYKDTTGDGVADFQELVYTGFGLSNVQGLLNTFLWGLDNRFHGQTSSSGGEVVPANTPDARPLSLRSRDFAFDPRTHEISPTSGGGQHGMSFDDWGRRFVCHNSDHIQLIMYEDRYIARNPYLQAPSSRISIALDGPAGDVYRISPVEPWRIVRTRLRMKGIVPGIVEGGGRPAGYFTSATGITIYTGDAMSDLKGMAFVGDVGSNLVHRKVLEQNGVELIARRIDEESEFLRSTDIWFRPAQFGNAPDGTLYILDVYREVIEHPASLPPIIKQHLDLNSGNDRGRIYRIVPEGFVQPPPVHLGDASSEELVQALDSPNGWTRTTAARLLYQRQDGSALDALETLARAAKTPEGRMRALYALDGLEALRAEVLLEALLDAAPQVRIHALILSEQFLRPIPARNAHEAQLLDHLLTMTADPDIRVRYQLAFSLGEAEGPQRNAALAQLAQQEPGNNWFQVALLSSLTTGSGEVFALLAASPEYRQSDAGRSLLEALARQAGASAQQVEHVLTQVDALPETEDSLAQAAVRGLLAGVKLRGRGGEARAAITRSPRVQALLQSLLEGARAGAAEPSAAVDQRVDAIQTLVFDAYPQVRDLLPPLLQQQHPKEVQLAALQTLQQFPEPEVGQLFLEGWADFGPEVRARAIEALFSRQIWVEALLNAMAAETFSPARLDSTRLQALLSYPDETISQQAQGLLASYTPAHRQEVVEAYQDVLDMPGDLARGRALFAENCAQCHKVEGTGFEVGPDLANIGNSGAEKILLNVLDPNAEINPQYINYTIETTDWETHSGIIDSETATSITLKRGMGETDTILRVNIEAIRSAELSIMPEGWEESLGKQGLADIIAYLMSLVEEQP